MKRYAGLGATILILQVLSYLTSYFVTQNAVQGWYRSIEKSALTPPDWVFPVVWFILYTMLAIVLWRLWERRDMTGAKTVLTLFMAQLILNYAWSFVFFGMGAFAAAFTMLLII